MKAFDEFYKIPCKPLAYLANKDMEYLTQLEEKGWTQLSVYPHYPKAFGLESIVDEELHLDHLSRVDAICLGSVEGIPRDKLWKERNEAYEKTGDVWELKFTAYKRALKKMEITEPERFKAIKAKVDVILKEHQAADLAHFASGEFDQTPTKDMKTNALVKVYVKVFGERLKQLGFEKDKQRSTTAKPAFTKPLLVDWDIVFRIDNWNLVRGKLEIWVGVFHKDNVKLDPQKQDQAITFKLLRFFNPGIHPSAPIPFFTFKSLVEMEVGLLAQADMYEIIQPDYEEKIKEGLLAWNASN